MASLPTRVQRHLWEDLSWYEETIYASGDLFFEALLNKIDQATSEIILATYIFNHDELGQRIIKHVADACARGVRVRVVFDGFGSMKDAFVITNALADAGVEVRIFHPLPWQSEIYQFSLRQKAWLANTLSRFLHVNQRHHAKMYIVDGMYLACGSLNISDVHISNGGNWRDYGAMVSGKSVADITANFDDFWHYRKPKLGRGLFSYYLSNISTYARKEKNKKLRSHIQDAKRRVWIVNPYFSPPHSLLKSLKRASNAGVDVRIIVPNKSDVGFFPLLTGTYYQELLNKGVRIFEYMPAMLHGKLLIADNKAIMGSTNLNYRSLIHDLEFDIMLDSNQSLQRLEHEFLHDQSVSREITIEAVKSRGPTRYLGWMLWLLRYWL